jgi:DNA-binding NarL/FixJ family response regulator
MENFLSPEERQRLKTQHKKERDKRICYRINVVLLYDRGWTCQDIAGALLLSDEAVRQHIQDYQATQKLKPENGGSESKLNNQQTAPDFCHLVRSENFGKFTFVKT